MTSKKPRSNDSEDREQLREDANKEANEQNTAERRNGTLIFLREVAVKQRTLPARGARQRAKSLASN